jgi:RND family efflux transporter MFP subunit
VKSRIIAGALLLAGCSRNPQPEAPAPRAETPEPLKATVWTTKGELYLEYPALVAGRKARFAIHLTRLSDFKAVKDATCEVRLARDTGAEIFPCDPSTHPGIFGANVEPKTRGDGRLNILVRGKDLDERFVAGAVKIAGDAASAERPAEPKQEAINFSKEQQWTLDFATQLAAVKPMRDVLRVSASTLPRTGGEAVVIAPIAGRIVSDKTYIIGSAIEQGIELTAVVPPAATLADPASIQLAEEEARLALDQAQRDRARAERLFAAGAAPARRAEDARSVEATAHARLQAAQTRLAQYNETRSAEGTGANARRVIVRAPISGVLTESGAISGANVEIGAVLFRIVDNSRLYVSGVVPESEISKMRQLSGAEIEMPDAGQVRLVSRLVAIGQTVDTASRTLPVTYEVENGDRRLAVNQTVFLRLLLKSAGDAPVVPDTSIVDDAGRPVVFIQTGGETFVRRPVKLGVRNGGVSQVLEGVSPGDRVVIKGAYLIRLSTMSSAVPAHGHVH